MERIFFVEKGDLWEINNLLQKGGRIKNIHPIAENVTCLGHTAKDESWSKRI